MRAPINQIRILLISPIVVIQAPLAHAQGGLEYHPYWTFRTHLLVTELSTGDINGDGETEVAIATTDGVGYVLENDGDLAWRYEAGFELADLLVDDLDVDGAADEIVAQEENQVVLSKIQRPV